MENAADGGRTDGRTRPLMKLRLSASIFKVKHYTKSLRGHFNLSPIFPHLSWHFLE